MPPPETHTQALTFASPPALSLPLRSVFLAFLAFFAFFAFFAGLGVFALASAAPGSGSAVPAGDRDWAARPERMRS